MMSTSCLRRSRSPMRTESAHVMPLGRKGTMRTQLFVVIGVLAAGAVSAQGQGGRCDRECLIGISEQYLDALAAKDPKRLPLANANIKYTENGQRLSLGDGLWNSITARGTYKLHVADQTAGQIVTFSTMRENGAPMI